jgi:acyl-coenzyme A thioesterase PaaI-like protein
VKPEFDKGSVARRVSAPPIEVPLREAAGFRSLDPSTGVVAVDLRPELLNPAGALQGAMVAGLAEAAAEDLADHARLLGTARHAVTELEVRYLAQNRVTPIATTARVIDAAGGLVRVDLHDDGGRGRLTSSVLARVRPALA